MVSNFGVGDKITINAPVHQAWHGKKGLIKAVKDNGGHIVTVVNERGQEVYVELEVKQMIKVVTDPALTKFMETLPSLTDESKAEYNTDKPPTKATDRELAIYQAAAMEGYMRGFNEGYVLGYQDACKDVNQLMILNGLTSPKPGDVDGNTNT